VSERAQPLVLFRHVCRPPVARASGKYFHTTLSILTIGARPEEGEIGAHIQLGSNAFHAFDALGVAGNARSAVHTDCMVMHDGLDEAQVGMIPPGEGVRQRFGNPWCFTASDAI
jgi:hypothetical protein